MARTVTLSSLRTQARYRSDMVGSNFVTDTEFDSYINASIAELYDLLVSAYGEDYFVSASPHSITTTANTDKYDLPDDFYKLVGVDAKIIGTDWKTLKRFNFNERNNYDITHGWTLYQSSSVRYRLLGSKIMFIPMPLGAHDVRLWYIPAPTILVDDDDTFDGISGWEEYVIIDVAIKALQKEESDVTNLLTQKKLITKRIEEMKENRDQGESHRVTDVYASDYDWYYLSTGSTDES